MDFKVLDKIYKDDKSKIRFLYKYFKKDINKWISNRNVNNICLYNYIKGENKGDYCLKLTDEKNICKEHNKDHKKYINEIRLYRNIDINYFPENPNIINNMLNYKVKYYKPTCPNFYDIYPLQKPDEIIKKKKKTKKIKSLCKKSTSTYIFPLKLITYNNYIYKNKKLNFNNPIKMDDKKEPIALLKQNLKIANNSIITNKLLDSNFENEITNKFKGYNLYKMNNKFIDMKIKNIYIYNSRLLNNIIKLFR